MASQFAALPALGRPDIVVSASPSFPALLPAIVNAGLRNLPWVLWLHDILPDGAAATGLVESGAVLDAARRLEHAAYRKADRIVVLSESFIQNLTAKGVPAHKLELVYDPATRWPDDDAIAGPRAEPPRVLSMGNIGYSQGLAPLVAAFERSRELADRAVRLAITGNGLAADDVRAETRTGRVEMLGLVDDARLEHELRTATIGFVSQHYEGAEFNIPSKLMNFMAYGLPVLAAVDPDSEVARLVRAAKGGWVVDSRTPDAFPEKVAEVLARPAEIEERGAAAREYARRHFSPEGFVSAFANSLAEVVAQRRGTTR